MATRFVLVDENRHVSVIKGRNIPAHAIKQGWEVSYHQEVKGALHPIRNEFRVKVVSKIVLSDAEVTRINEEINRNVVGAF